MNTNPSGPALFLCVVVVCDIYYYVCLVCVKCFDVSCLTVQWFVTVAQGIGNTLEDEKEQHQKIGEG